MCNSRLLEQKLQRALSQCALMGRGGSTSLQSRYCMAHNKYLITTGCHLVNKQCGADSALGCCVHICNCAYGTRSSLHMRTASGSDAAKSAHKMFEHRERELSRLSP